MRRVEAARDLLDSVALWHIGEVEASEVVMAMCEALGAGWDGPTARILASRTRAEAADALPELLPVALDELGFVWPGLASVEGQEAAARAFARRMLAGKLTTRQLARRMCCYIDRDLPCVAPFAALDDEYESLADQLGRTEEQLDIEAIVRARRLARRPASWSRPRRRSRPR